ncbi:MAG: hypothetical protein IJT39_09380 [Bacteroidales bacterium]|nr:hypothetical protein [Bacteroidales bacterium]
MGSPFIRIGWNKYETALLIDAYERVASGEESRKDAIKRLSDRLRNRMLLNGIEVSDKYRNENGIAMQMSAIEYCMTHGEKGFENPSKMFVDIAYLAMEDRVSFKSLLEEALKLYPEPVTHVVYEPQQKLIFDFVREAEISDDYTLGQIKEILSQRFAKGFRIESSIELKRFRHFYLDYTGREYQKSDDCLTNDINACGIISDSKLFVPERILSNDVKRDIVSFIEETFNTRRGYLYYKTLFHHFENELLDSIIVNEGMLRSYVSFYYGDRWFFFKDYMTCSRNVEPDIDAEVLEFVKSQGCVVTEDETVEALEYLPADDVHRCFNSHPVELVSSGRNQRFHIDLFIATNDELDAVSRIIDRSIEQYEFIGHNELFDDIRKEVPSLIKNNGALSDYGIRKALSCKLEGRYSFNNAIVSKYGNNLSAKDALLSFAKLHETYTLAEVDALAESLGTVLNYHLETLLEYSVRINHDMFIRKSKVHYDVDAIDYAIGLWCTESQPFIPLKSISDFVTFPEGEFPWTQRLLESFLLTSSNRFKLLRGDCLNKNNVCGVVVRSNMKELSDINSSQKPFDTILSFALIREHIPLVKEKALDFLARDGYIVQRRYSQIEQVLAKARAIDESNKNKLK